MRKREKTVKWWQWVLTILGVMYGVFVLEVIVGFLDEGATRAALVMGIITGMADVIWGVLLWRFVFARTRPDQYGCISRF